MRLSTCSPNSCRPNARLPGSGGSLPCLMRASETKHFSLGSFSHHLPLSPSTPEPCSFLLWSSLIQGQGLRKLRGWLLDSMWSWIKEVPRSSGPPRTSAFEEVQRVTWREVPGPASFPPWALGCTSLEISLTPTLSPVPASLYSRLVRAVSPAQAHLPAGHTACPPLLLEASTPRPRVTQSCWAAGPGPGMSLWGSMPARSCC